MVLLGCSGPSAREIIAWTGMLSRRFPSGTSEKPSSSINASKGCGLTVRWSFAMPVPLTDVSNPA